MFESLLPYRKEVALDLIQQISAKTLPHALLFSGVPFSGRLSLALDNEYQFCPYCGLPLEEFKEDPNDY